jgi:uncharacterized phiE125 gp8 family phage protein
MINCPSPDRKSGRQIIISVEPTVEPITVSELKFWARIDGSDEDTVLGGIITTARKNLEHYIKRTLIQTTIQLYMDSWDFDSYELPYSPVISISAVETLDESDTATVYSSSNYYLVKGNPYKIAIKQDSTNPLNTERDYGGFRITYLAGYGTTAADVPQALKDAVATWATYIYENRDPNPEPPEVVKNLVSNFMIINV